MTPGEFKKVFVVGFSGLLLIASTVRAEDALPSAPKAPPPTAATAPVIASDDQLYKAFGGHDGLVKITDDLIDIVLKDGRIAPFFEPAAVDKVKLKGLLVEQFCQILNGGCSYSGRDMSTVHSQLGITQADFYALVEDLQIAMDRNKVPFGAQNRLLAALAPQSRDIIFKTPALEAK